MSTESYETLGAVWRDVASTCEDRVLIEIVDGEVQITTVTADAATAVTFENVDHVKELRNLLNRAIKRLS